MTDTTMKPATTQAFDFIGADTGLKILGLQQWAVPVQVRPGAPSLVNSAIYLLKIKQSLNASKGVIWSDLVSFPGSTDTTMTPPSRSLFRSKLHRVSGAALEIPGGTMAKRLTDTTKWKRPWFRALGMHAKVLWQYMCDECDHAGIFIADFDLISFQVGFKVDEAKLKSWLGTKLVQIDRDKYFIPSFFEFQYADAKDGFKAKQSAIKILTAFGLIDETGLIIDLTNRYLSVQEQSPDCPSISISKIKIKSNTGSAEGEIESLYRGYPRKQGKSSGIKRLVADLRAGAQSADMILARDHYIAHLKRENVESKFVLHFSTWANQWRDWLDPSHGTAENFGKNGSGFDWDKYEADKAAQGVS